MDTEKPNESSYSKAAGSIKKTIRRIFIALIILVILGVGFVGWSFYAAIYKWQSPAAVDVEIEQGMSAMAIAQRLYENGVIKTPTIFSYYVRLRGVGGDVKAGEYEFPAGINSENVLAMMVKGQVKKYQLQIIEGWTIKDIVKYIAGLEFIKDPAISADFERLAADKAFIGSLGFKDVPTLEGYLFPDTYEVFRPKSAEEIIKKMIAKFREVYTPEFTALADRLQMTQQQIVTLASVIEKETGKAEERPVISSVFWNRMKQNMALQSDPTTIYGIPNFSGNLTRADLENGANLYNTYMHLGLPPGPICNPGKASIEAALNPANTRYLYFVSRNDGTHVFSENLEDHVKAVAQYQLGRAFATGPEQAPAGEVQPPPGVTAIPPFVSPTPAPVVPGAPALPAPAVPAAPVAPAAPVIPPAMPAQPVVPPAAPAPAPAPAPVGPQALPGPSMAPPQPVAPAAPAVPAAPAAPAVTPPAAPAVPPAAPATQPKAVTPAPAPAPAPTTPAAPTPTPAPTTPSAPAPSITTPAAPPPSVVTPPAAVKPAAPPVPPSTATPPIQ